MKFDDSKRIIDETKKNENESSSLKRLRIFFLNNPAIVKIKPVINNMESNLCESGGSH